MSSASTASPGDPALAQARALVLDLFARSAMRHWLDMLASVGLGAGAFVLTPLLAWSPLLAALAFVVSVLALYRASIFVHEIAHFDAGDLPGFRLVWDLLCGAPMLVPSFLYEHHREHHRVGSYATSGDAEYFPFANKGRLRIALFVAANLLVPVAAFLRLLVLTPLGWVSARVAAITYTHASALSINPDFRAKPLRSLAQRRAFRVREALSFVYAAGFCLLFVRGEISALRALQAWAVIACVALLNAVRILVSHQYEIAISQVSLREQILDSCNFPDQPWLNGLWAPLGLRFHALHHLFPRLPYHALARAHARLTKALPQDSFYHGATQPSLPAALAALWRRAGRQAIRLRALHPRTSPQQGARS